MIPVEDQRLDAGTLEQWSNVLADHLGAQRRIEPHPWVVGGFVCWLVLHRHSEDRYSFCRVTLDELPKVLSEGIIELGAKRALDQASRRLHPAGRAPGVRDELQLRIDRQRCL